MLKDIAILTGGYPFMTDLGRNLDSATPRRPRARGEGRGRQGQHHDHRRQGQKAEIKGRIEQIRAAIEETTSDYDREKLSRSGSPAWRGAWP
jgi:chaperonin GroEL